MVGSCRATGIRIVAEKGEDWVYVEIERVKLDNYPTNKSCAKFEGQLRTEQNDRVKDLRKALAQAATEPESSSAKFIIYVDKLMSPDPVQEAPASAGQQVQSDVNIKLEAATDLK